jgi:ABC-type transport system involved in multi-copper enzyme maturation permease subunit
MFTKVRYILLTAMRDWLFAGTAIVEVQEMTLSYTAASARIVVMTGLIVFACFHVRNAFDTKEIDVFLSRPITRSSLIFSYWLGFATVALLLVIPTIGMVAAQGLISKKGFFFWSISLLIECWTVVAISLFASFTLKSAVTSVMASMGFYVLARMMGFFMAITHSGFLFEQRWLNIILTTILKVVSTIMPRLDFFSKSEWLIYGLKQIDDLELFATQAAVFVPLLIFATIIDFKRKQF